MKAEHKLESKDHIFNMNLRNVRTLFRVRSHMTDVKMNQKSNKIFATHLWKCEYCFS